MCRRFFCFAALWLIGFVASSQANLNFNYIISAADRCTGGPMNLTAPVTTTLTKAPSGQSANVKFSISINGQSQSVYDTVIFVDKLPFTFSLPLSINLSGAGSHTVVITATAQYNGGTEDVARSQDLIYAASGPSDINAFVFPEYCGKSNGILQALSAVGGTGPFSFHLQGAGKVPEKGAFGNLAAGDYIIEVTDKNGCTFAEKLTIPYIPGPQADFDIVYDTESAPANVRFINYSSGATSFCWHFGTGDLSSAPDPSYIFNDGGDYEVKLVANSANGCTDSTTRKLSLAPAVFMYVPSAFSPDNDQINDDFHIHTLNIKKLVVRIYDRTGQIVTKLTDQAEWDGKIQGQLVKAGTYVIDVAGLDSNDKWHKHYGTLTVVW